MYKVKESHINFIKTFYYFANLLALTPPYDFEKSKVKYQNIYRIYAFMLTLFFISLYLYSTYGMCKQFQNDEVVEAEFILELLRYGLMQLLCILNILRSTYRQGNIWKHFLVDIQNTDNNLIRESNIGVNLKLKKTKHNNLISKMLDYYNFKLKMNNRYHFNFKTTEFLILKLEIIGLVILFLILIYNIHSWIKTSGFFYYQSYIIENIELVYIYVIVVLSSNFAIFLKEKFKLCNSILKNIKFESIQPKKCRGIIRSKKICFATNLYIQLFYLVDNYTVIFGPSFLLLFGSIFVGFLDSINYLLIYGYSRIEEAVLYLFLNFLFLVSKFYNLIFAI